MAVTVWGIVGSEAAKFTPVTEPLARAAIRALFRPGDKVVSGKCHLGGIDLWSIEEARKFGLECWEHPPKTRSWDYGYKPRNILIAQDCTEAVCITLKTLPPSYDGMRFPFCYHCRTNEHVKSGGCWTVNYARSLGKPGRIIVIEDDRPKIAEDLRSACRHLRLTPMPLSDLIPLLQRAADALDNSCRVEQRSSSGVS